ESLRDTHHREDDFFVCHIYVGIMRFIFMQRYGKPSAKANLSAILPKPDIFGEAKIEKEHRNYSRPTMGRE
ncbi:MAG: hypothetical protein K2I32_04895, partial [Alistipes sp.]|nr:hypothetical protein [Alistipes sp.]